MRLRILALLAAAACALVATWTLSRAQSPKTPGVADATAGAAVSHATSPSSHSRSLPTSIIPG